MLRIYWFARARRSLTRQMATQKQIEANRCNALKSTGPKTAEGKAASRINALQHGLTAAQVVIAGEDPEEYARLLESLRMEFSPLGGLADHLVELLAEQMWRLRRISRFEGALLAWQQRADLVNDKNVPAMARMQSIRRLPLPTDLGRARLGAQGADERAGDRDFDTLHRLGRTVQKLLTDQDYLHRLGRYETMLAKNFDRTLQALLRLTRNRRRTDGAAAVDKPYPEAPPPKS